MLKKLTLLVKHALSYLPSKLPTGTTELQSWMDSIIELAGPLADKRSMEFVISSTLLHYDTKLGGYIPKRYFVRRLFHSAACQLAHYKFQEIKVAQAEELEAAKKAATEAEVAKQSVAVTAPTQESVPTDALAVQKTTN